MVAAHSQYLIDELAKLLTSYITYLPCGRTRAADSQATGTCTRQALRSGFSLGSVPRGQNGNRRGFLALAVISNKAERDVIAFKHWLKPYQLHHSRRSSVWQMCMLRYPLYLKDCLHLLNHFVILCTYQTLQLDLTFSLHRRILINSRTKSSASLSWATFFHSPLWLLPKINWQPAR